MSSKQGHEFLESYTDNIKVKISERYKPPPRINTAMSYSQRLTLNKQTQDNMPTYEFSLENTVLVKMKEWKNARIQASQERQLKLEKCREEVKKKEQERIEQETLEKVEAKTGNETAAAVTNINNNFINTPTTVPFAVSGTNTNDSYTNYSTANSILQPTQVSNSYSSILTPIPLQTYDKQQFSSKKDDKSPFNISDFENDTSSPFDNMELKSINDMEELALVLNRGEQDLNINTPSYPIYQSVQPSVQTNITPSSQSYTGYVGNQYSYNIPNSYITPATSNYSHTNGYYYPSDMISASQSVRAPYSLAKTNTIDYGYNPMVQGSSLESKKSNCKSVPDIVNALETELENIQVSNIKPPDGFIRSSGSPQPRPKSTDEVYSILKKKPNESENLLSSLSKSEQELCRSISSMGFPIPRVARVCKLMGSDQKRVSLFFFNKIISTLFFT